MAAKEMITLGIGASAGSVAPFVLLGFSFAAAPEYLKDLADAALVGQFGEELAAAPVGALWSRRQAV